LAKTLTTAFAQVFSRVADMAADREIPTTLDIVFDFVPDWLGYRLVVHDPVSQVITVYEKIIDIIFVILRRYVVALPAVESNKSVVVTFCPVVLFGPTGAHGSDLLRASLIFSNGDCDPLRQMDDPHFYCI
jgi:hypothetical protein